MKKNNIIKYIKKDFLSIIVIALCFVLNIAMFTNYSHSNANSVIPYVMDDEVQCVNINDIAQAYGAKIEQLDGGIQTYINGKKIRIYDNDSYIYVDSSAIPYQTFSYTKGNETFNIPTEKKPTKVNGGYLVPKEIINVDIGLKCDEDGIHVGTALTVNSDSFNTSTDTDSNNGWKTINGQNYFYKNGCPQTGWIKSDNYWYYLGPDGIMRIGWIQVNGKWYYLYNDGKMATNTTIDNYYVDNNGVWTGSSSANNTSSGNGVGISYSELNNRVQSLGYSQKKYFPAGYGFSAGYGYYWKYNSYGDISVYDDMFNIVLKKNDAEYHQANKQIFNWLLPTQGDYLDNILCTNPSNQTLTLDGRTVKIKMLDNGISVTIKG